MGITAYYNVSPVMSRNGVLNFIMGARGLGKTYGFKHKAIKDNIRTGEEFIYLRRYKEELSAARATFFEDIAGAFPRHDFRLNAGRAERAPRLKQRDTETDKEFAKREKERKWVTMAYFVALSTGQRFKSVSYPRVTKIIFDEFIIEKGNIQYLPDETTTLINFLSTVDRYKDKTAVYFLANAVSINNPYFIKYQIRPDESGEWIVMQDGFIVCHFPDSEKFKNEVYQTRFGKFIQNTDYADYAVGNTFTDNHDNLIRTKSSDAAYRMTLETKSGVFTVWSEDNQEYSITRRQVRGDAKVYTLDPNKMDDGKVLMVRNHPALGVLRTAFNQGKVWFDMPSTRNIFIDIFSR